MIEVPFLEVGATYHELKAEMDAAVMGILKGGWFILGPEVARFEEEYARFSSADHCIGVGNGLEALHLGLLAMDIGNGDEVIVPSNTYIATWLAVSQTGATPVPVEPDEKTFNMDPGHIEEAITEKTKLILPVHLYGQPADMEPILEIAQNYNLNVLEDAAQAHGARYKGQRLGAHGDAAAWSFYPVKNLGAFGDGGAITTNSEELCDTLRLLGNYGSKKKCVHELKGCNSRLDPMQAAVLSVKLRHLDEWNGRRKTIAAFYTENLTGTGLVLPEVPEWADPVWHVYVVRTPQRDKVQEELRDKGIGTLVHYPIPPHLQGAYRELPYEKGSFPIAETMADTMLSLPISPHLTEEQAEAVVTAIKSLC